LSTKAAVGLNSWDAEYPPVEKRIAEMNLERFRKRLEVETDQAKRAILRRLIMEEEDKLHELQKKDAHVQR
jgi:hypothetical protein